MFDLNAQLYIAMADDSKVDMIQPESSGSDGDLEINDAGSSWTAGSILTSNFFRRRIYDGRAYAVFGQEEYGLPVDAKESERADLAHAKYFALLDKKRFLAPIPSQPQSIMDLGCGTGAWCIDIADTYPSAEVVGIDIAHTQPDWLPPNCRFEIADMEQPWPWRQASLDFIFCRDPIIAVKDFPALIDRAYTHLKPGGWVEFQSVIGDVHCDDDSLPEGSWSRQLCDRLHTCSQAYGALIDDPVRWKAWFEKRGFEAVTEQVLKVPCNTWPKDPRLKLVGAFQLDNHMSNLVGLCMRLFRKTLGWSVEQVQEFVGEAQRELMNSKYHTYLPFYVTYARKPLEHEK